MQNNQLAQTSSNTKTDNISLVEKQYYQANPARL